MPHLILERYYLGAIVLIIIIVVINFTSAVNTYLESNKSKRHKNSFKIDFFFVVYIVALALNWYQSSKHELKNMFESGNKVICKSKSEFIVISKKLDYILKDDYFIKSNHIIDIDKCKTLEEQR